MSESVIIRPAGPADWAAIHTVQTAAFGRPDEAALALALEQSEDLLLTLLAEQDGGPILGHIQFSRLWITGPAGREAAVALGPLAVLPTAQRQGIGSLLVMDGLARLADEGETLVVVLGDPGFYSRFGFEHQAAAKLRHPFPPEHYTALALKPRQGPAEGLVQYAAPFGIA